MEGTGMNWRKSSYSSSNGGNCVEVGHAAGTVAVRDTKDNGNGPVLSVTSSAWERFTKSL
jgi:hypothetical protein